VNDKNENIKPRILSPIILAGILLIILSLSGAYWLQGSAIDNSVIQRVAGVDRLFEKLLQEESQVMNGQIDFLKTEPALFNLFLARDRENLIDNARPLFERMRSKYRVTHFYFHGKDQVCFLRVHSPGRHGDFIDRSTMKGAVSTGKPFHGIELGPLGTFTLRVVHPWMVGDTLIGYIELGMEIEHLTRLIKQALNLELLVLIEKKHLDRADWEAGLKILNRTGSWDLFQDFVIIDRTMEGSVILDEKLRTHLKDDSMIFSANLGDRYYRGHFNDLIDAGSRRVGEIVSLVDITAQQTNLKKLIFWIAGLFIVIGGGLLLFFNSFIGAIQNRLITSREKLRAEIEIRRKSEKALKVSEKRFRSLFEESKDTIVSTDRDGNLQMINPAGMELFGLTDADRKTANFLDFCIEQDMPRKFLTAMSEKGYIRDFGAHLKGKKGLPMDCLMTVNAKQSSDGKVAGYEGIVRDVTPYKRMEEKLRQLATTDSLTGINNRRNFVELAQKEINRSKRYGNPFSLLMLDIDHFKKINDTYGHSSGDQVLIEFCGLCLKEIRESDVMGRLGGEEFAIALVKSDAETAEVVAERINGSVSSCPVTVNGQQICFTVSIGVTVMYPNDHLDSILERSDNALYQAKENGRNQVRTCILTDKQFDRSK